ncbi:MAG TPA: DUF4440 domain-containing protein [Cyclobacteriaceae bacterium]|nr:DUF4440 domain-containing protein [Cyclobacteriaceae bacterium]
MKRSVFSFLAFVGIISASYAQQGELEINEQVWKPFIENFSNRNTAGFMAVHSKDVVRSPRDSKAIFGWDEYNRQLQQSQSKTPRGTRSIELRFTERIIKDNLAFDVGIFKTTFKPNGGTPNDYYGRFHVILRKENGTWKILVDTDSSEGGTIGEKDFLAAREM